MSEVHLTLIHGTDSITARLFENESISQTFRFTDIQNFSTKGGFSREFRLPADPINLGFFGAIYSPNFTGGWFDFRKKIEATLSVDTIPIAIGHIQVKKVISDKTGPRDIECVFYSELPDIVTAIGDKQLADLTDLPNLNHALEYASLTASAAGTLESGNVIYSLCDRGQNFTEEGTGQPIFNGDDPLYCGDLTPCLSALYIWQQIIDDAGFYYGGSAVDTELARWWIPWLNKKDVQTVETPDESLFKVYRATDLTGVTSGYTQITGLTELFDNGTNFASNQFTAPYTGTFTFKGWAHFTRTSGSGVTTVGIVLRKGGVTNVAASFPPTIVNSGSTFAAFLGPSEIFMVAGETIALWSLTQASQTFTFEGEATADENLGTGFSCIAASYPLQDATVSMPLNSPKMKQIDFLRAVITMMNLSVIPDKSSPNTLLFEPIGDFINSGSTLDWTKKLDIDKDISIYPTNEFQRKSLKWTYKPDGDAFNQLFQDQAGRTYGQIEFKDTGNDFATGEQVSQIEFRPTPCNQVAGTNIIIPRFVTASGEFFAFGPRVLYQPNSVTGVKVYDFDTATVTDTEVLLLNHYASSPINVPVDDLNFGQETPLHPIESRPYNTLYNRYHRTYMRELYGGLGAGDLFDQALIMEAHFHLTLLDIHNLSFADQIFIKDTYWRILEVNDYVVGEDQTTRVKLIKKIDVQLECEYIPVAEGTGGQVIFEDAEGDEVDGSQACCEFFGYTWNDTVSKCYSNNGPGGPVRPTGTSDPTEPVVIPAGLILGQVTIEDSFTVGDSEHTIFANVTRGNITITLPKAGARAGRILEVMKTDSSVNTVTIDANGSELINGATTKVLSTQYQTTKIQSNGLQWYILS
jgi:hypothetical protein